jgi:hypothetical protein
MWKARVTEGFSPLCTFFTSCVLSCVDHGRSEDLHDSSWAQRASFSSPATVYHVRSCRRGAPVLLIPPAMRTESQAQHRLCALYGRLTRHSWLCVVCHSVFPSGDNVKNVVNVKRKRGFSPFSRFSRRAPYGAWSPSGLFFVSPRKPQGREHGEGSGAVVGGLVAAEQFIDIVLSHPRWPCSA